ncbi:MAG TPA: hypothetical protein DCW29_23445 [Janthinobacterium sp.]|nr:hypothetical protein [Janthinobacterium sp.]
MVTRLPVIESDGEVGDLSGITASHFKPAAEVLSPSLLKKLGVRGPQALKGRITIHLSRDVLETFQAMGEGWQTRMDAALRDWLKDHPAA